jgi:aryl-alcohol dehydrogenase-like predicted oxidoreductase
MEYRRLGRSNLLVSSLWLGGMSLGSPKQRPWVADRETSTRIIAKAIELGINTIDTADAYAAGESEEVIGKTLSDMGIRENIVIATKFGLPFESKLPNRSGYSRKYIIRRCEDALRRLKTDYIDILQTHIWNPQTEVEEVASAFDWLIQQGKVLYAGATEMPVWLLAKWIYHGRFHGLAPLISVQHHYNALWREDERALIPLCWTEGVGLVAYSPIGRGFLAGASRQTTRERTDELIKRFYHRESDRHLQAEIGRLAASAAVHPAELALLWTIRQPHVTSVVIGPTSVDHLVQLVAAVDKDVDAVTLKSISDLYAVRAEMSHG